MRLFLDAGFSADVVRLAELRHALSFWLRAPGGGELVLPDEPERAYRDALLVSAGAWSKLFGDGQCEITFTLFDPIAYGRERIERLSRFDVGGTWPVLPEFRLVAASGSSLRVGHAAAGRSVTVDYEFAGGEAVVIDCASERAFINDADARDCVALGSGFFSLDPGDRIVSAYGATRFEARFAERRAQMAGAVPTIFRFDRRDARIGTPPVAGGLVHTEELSGEGTVGFSSWETPGKGDRLLWLDGDVWREHVIVRAEEPMAGVCSVYAESSLCELLDDLIEEAQLVNRTALQALTAALAPTRWLMEHCDQLGTAGCLVCHQNALWALRRVAEVWKGEVTPAIAVSGGRVAYRAVRLDAQRGSWRGLRSTYGKNMAGCARTVLEQDVHAALCGFGRARPTPTARAATFPATGASWRSATSTAG